jgi:hypothetical protein
MMNTPLKSQYELNDSQGRWEQGQRWQGKEINQLEHCSIVLERDAITVLRNPNACIGLNLEVNLNKTDLHFAPSTHACIHAAGGLQVETVYATKRNATCALIALIFDTCAFDWHLWLGVEFLCYYMIIIDVWQAVCVCVCVEFGCRRGKINTPSDP